VLLSTPLFKRQTNEERKKKKREREGGEGEIKGRDSDDCNFAQGREILMVPDPALCGGEEER